jgi:hypothetical protein
MTFSLSIFSDERRQNSIHRATNWLDVATREVVAGAPIESHRRRLCCTILDRLGTVEKDLSSLRRHDDVIEDWSAFLK